MADIQAAMPARFLPANGASKLLTKDVPATSAQLDSFFGVLKSQIGKQDKATETLPDALLLQAAEETQKTPLEVKLDAGLDAESGAGLDTDPGLQEAFRPPLAMQQANESASSQASWGTGSLPATTADLNAGERQQADSLRQGSESTAMPLQATVSPDLTAAIDKPESAAELAGNAAAAAIAAAVGQALPPGKAAKSAETSRMETTNAVEAKGGAAGRSGEKSSSSGLGGEVASDSPPVLVANATTASNAASQNAATIAASGANVGATTGAASGATPAVTATNNPINLALPFDQALRQAEAKINVAIEAPVRSSAFAAELGDKVVWLATRQGQFADLSLNPPQMGPLEVRLNLSGSGDASAQFFSANPAVREAIDAALPKLRELMAQAGITLGDAEVREHAFNRREQAELRGQNAAKEGDIPVSQGVMAGIGGGRTAGIGLVDLYI